MPVEIAVRERGADRSTETDLDDGLLFRFAWDAWDPGIAEQPEPEVEQTQRGLAIWLPLPETYEQRRIRLIGYRDYTSANAKLHGISELTKLLCGAKTLRIKGREIDVFGKGLREIEDTKPSPFVLGFELDLTSLSEPFWKSVDTLNSIAYDSMLYPDMGIPVSEAQPPYLFGRDLAGSQAITANPILLNPHFTINNWGTALTYATASVSGAGALTEVYLSGVGVDRVRIGLSGGNGSLLEASKFLLSSGDNPIWIQNAAGSALDLTAYPNFRIDFGATVLRYL